MAPMTAKQSSDCSTIDARSVAVSRGRINKRSPVSSRTARHARAAKDKAKDRNKAKAKAKAKDNDKDKDKDKGA